MASTTALEESFDWIRNQLAGEAGVSFAKRTVPLTTGGQHTFNAVAADGSLIATITNSSGATSGRKKPVGKLHSAINYIYFLSLVSAPRRMLIVTNPEFDRYLRAELAGALAPGIEVTLIELPAELSQRVGQVTRDASDEMTR